MKTPIDFGKEFLYRLFDQRDADACQKMLAGDLVWITPENMHHFLSEGAVLKFVRKQMKAETESRYVDLISIKSSPSADNIMTVAYEINLVSREEERPLYLRCSMVICRRSKRLEITFLHFSKKSERDSSEQLRAFIANLPCGVMILACLDGQREEAIFYNEYFANRLRYKQDEFARAMAQNPFFMASEEDRDRIHEEIAQARKNGGSITANLRFYRRDGNSFYYRMKGAPAYQADGGTVYYCVFQETTGFQMTTDRLQERLDAATEIVRQIPEAICGIEYPPDTKPAGSENEAAASADGGGKGDAAADAKTSAQEADGDVKIYRGNRRGNRSAEKAAAAKKPAGKISRSGPKVFFTSKNIPAMFGVSNSVYMKNILEDPFYGLEVTSITRDRLLSSFIFNPDKTATGKAVSCGIFRVQRPDQADDKAIRVELMVRRVRDKDGTMRLYLFYYDREAMQQEMEGRVERASKMGRAGQEQLRADLRKVKDNAARRQNELTEALKAAEKKYTGEIARIENSLTEEKKRSIQMSRQLEESMAAQKQIAEERQRVEEDATRRIRNHEARAQRQVKEACSARDLLEEQLREAQERSRTLELQLQREKSRRMLLEEKYKQLEEQSEELRKEKQDSAFPAAVKISESIGAGILPAAGIQAPASTAASGAKQSAPASTAASGAKQSAPASVAASTVKQSAPASTADPGVMLSAAADSAVIHLRTENSSGRAPLRNAARKSGSAGTTDVRYRADAVRTGGREGDWMTQSESLTVFSSIDPVHAVHAGLPQDRDQADPLPEKKRSAAAYEKPLLHALDELETEDDERAAKESSSGGTALLEETFSPESFLRNIMIYEESVCADKPITLRLYFDSRFPSSVIGFASLLRQALCEIVENAIGRARPGGYINVRCRADRPSGGFVNLYFRIEDNGTAIPGTGMQTMFEGDQAADAGAIDRPGLYAAQEAAALMGGSLDARSNAGKTRFSLTVALRV